MYMKRIGFLLLGLVLFTSLRAQVINPDYIDGVVYFQLKSDFPAAALRVDGFDRIRPEDVPLPESLREKYGVTLLLRPFHLFGNEALLRTVEVHFERMEAVDSLVMELEGLECVAFAEKVPLLRLLGVPNDPYYGKLNGRNWKWHLDMINAEKAWSVQTGKASVKVAVVDNFVWEGHPDLQLDSANLCSISISYAGYKYNVGTATPPSSIAQGSTEKAYYASHGTHCMGLVGATSNNSTGIASIASGVTLMGVSASTSQYPQAVLYGMQGVQWAAEHGADIISMSFGSSASSQVYSSIIDACYKAGIIMLAAAGNEGDDGNAIIYPAGFSTVISVASVDGDGKLSYFSQWGPGRADIACPGGFILGESQYPNILSTTFCSAYLAKLMGFTELNGTYYDGMQGTSMACPLAAGVVGLLLSKEPGLTPDAVKLRLQRTARPLNSASAHTIDGYGYIDAYAALCNEYLVLSTDTLRFSKESGWKSQFQVESSKSWKLSGLPDWLSASKSSGDSGVTSVVLTTLSANNGDTARHAVLTVTGEGMSHQLYVVQESYKLEFVVDRKDVLLSGGRGVKDTLHVHSTIPWSMKNESSWLTAGTHAIGSDSALIVLNTRSSNSTGSIRESMLILSLSGMPDDTIRVRQRAADFITLSTSQVQIAPEAGSKGSMQVFSNVGWQVTGGDSSWLLPDRMSGIDTAEITFTVIQENGTGEVRSAVFYITNGSITKSVTVMQQHKVAVREAGRDSIQVFPNPTNGQVVCRMPGNVNAEVRVSDIQGRLLQVIAMKDGYAVLDLSAYQSGMYLLRCGNATAKVVKQ